MTDAQVAQVRRHQLTGTPAAPASKNRLSEFLDLERCPYCNVAKPSLRRVMGANITQDHQGKNQRKWCGYVCGTCGGVVLAAAPTNGREDGYINEIYPYTIEVEEEIPERARRYLKQAVESLSAPDGAVMLAASAVDAMLKEKNLSKGSLYERIATAAEQHIITADMARWATQVRLDANDSRHADDCNPHHDPASAKRAVEFTRALGQFLFVLPSKVTRGIEDAGGTPSRSAG